MKLYSTIRVTMNEHEVLKQPGVLDRVRRALGREPELATGSMRATLECATLVDAHRRALAEVIATDAVSLVVDELILFEDRDRRPDDLGDLLLAFHEYAPAISAEFRVLRLTAEHMEAGIHYVIELQARTQYPKGEEPVRIIVSGRLAELQPRPGETAEDYRARVEPLLQDRGAFQVARASFDSFMSRMRDAIARAVPDAHASVIPPEPTPAIAERRREQRPDDRDYDPHEVHYPNPLFGMLGMAMVGWTLMPGLAAATPDSGVGEGSSSGAGGDGGAGGAGGDGDTSLDDSGVDDGGGLDLESW